MMVMKLMIMMMMPFNFILEYVMKKFKENQERPELNDQNPMFGKFSKSFIFKFLETRMIGRVKTWISGL
jgi:hypothetical protein